MGTVVTIGFACALTSQMQPPAAEASADPQSVKWLLIPAVRNTSGGVFEDVMSHSRESPATYGDRATTAHETLHGINSYLRNKYPVRGKRTNGLYLGQNQAVILEEPRLRKSAVAAFVPAVLRGSRFDTYVVGQREWDDTATYLLDEWICYILGAEAALESTESGDGSKCDIVYAAAEFAVYGTALLLAVEQHCPDYLRRNPSFAPLIAVLVERSLEVYARGLKTKEYAWRTGLITKIRSSPETAPIRERWAALLASSEVAGLKFAPRDLTSLVTLSGSIEGDWSKVMPLPEGK
jgi:hypothetical protein